MLNSRIRPQFGGHVWALLLLFLVAFAAGLPAFAEEPIAEEPAAEEPIAEGLGAEVPIAAELDAEAPAAEGLGAEVPIAAELDAEEPLAEESGDDVAAAADITADTIEHERGRDLYVAKGNVRIAQEGRVLTADWVSFSNTTRKGVASGNVVITDATDTVRANFLSFDIDTLRGTVFDGEVDDEGRGFRMEGSEISKLDERTYEIEDAKFTTCRCPDDLKRNPWQIRATEAKVEVEGYGTARNTTFDVLGVPVVWLPWMIYPVKTERSTGFLLPSISSDEIATPFFWAARDNINLTFTPRFDFEHGFNPVVDMEYVFGERSEGELHLSYINDNDVEQGTARNPYTDDRWGVQWRHDQFLPEDWRFKTNVTAVSDNDYPFDFHGLHDVSRGSRFIESDGSLSKRMGSGGQYGFVAQVVTADDLQNPDDDDRDRLVLQQLPKLSLTALPHETPVPFLVAAMDTSYTYYRAWGDPEDSLRGAGAPGALVGGQFFDTGVDGTFDTRERNNLGVRDATFPAPVWPGGPPNDFHGDNAGVGGTEGDGIFQEGEPLADRGHRLRLNPRLGVPLRIADVLEFYPEIGYNEVLYSTRLHGGDERGQITGRMELRTRLRGEMDVPFASASVAHVLEPRIGYAIVQDRGGQKTSDPLFIPGTAVPQDRLRQLSLDSITRDPADRVDRFHGATVGFGNRFFVNGETGPRLVADVDVSALYNFPGSEWGLAVVQGRVFPMAGLRTRFVASYDLEESQMDEGMVQVNYSTDRGDDIGATYRYRRNIPLFYEDNPYNGDRFDNFDSGFDRINQASINGRWAVHANWALIYRVNYSFAIGELLNHRGGVEYVSRCRCWAIQAAVSDHRNGGPRFEIRYTLMGLGDDTIRPFGGGRRGVIESGNPL